MAEELLRMGIRVEHDIFTVRQAGREVAGIVGLEHQDQIRVATALSEIGRQMFALAGGAAVSFHADGPPPVLLIEVLATAQAQDGLAGALESVGRLVDLTFGDRDGAALVSLTRRLPLGSDALGPGWADGIRAQLGGLEPTSPYRELIVQNDHLLATLGEVQRQRDELLRLNAELEETNRGVMALYTQLSEELEETNRGVVALYAELDKRSAQLREANEAKSRFLANVSHELRAPVTAIIGLTRLLTDAESDPLTGGQGDQIDLIESSAADLLVLVNDLLDLAKAESGRLEPRWEEVRLDRLLGQLEATSQPLVTRPEVRLVVECGDDVPVVVTDGMLLTRVLRNLVTNALKFTEQGHVRVSCVWHAADATVELAVEDTGVGIGPAETERIFEEFYQVRGPRRTGGTGLGLPYARRVAEVLGGSLTVRSESGVGSTFTVVLPQVPPADPGPPGGRVGHVLVVDDDPAFRAVVVGAVRDDAERVSQAANGRQALEMIADDRPDAIFLDLRMPELEGERVLATLAADEGLRTIPVVVVTGVPPDNGPEHAVAMVAKDRATPETLRAALRTAVGGDFP